MSPSCCPGSSVHGGPKDEGPKDGLGTKDHEQRTRLHRNESRFELEARAQTEYVQHLHLAVVCSALGDMDRAFELLARGVRDHNGWIGTPRMPMFENFRRDPRYAEHLRRIGHPDAEWAATT